MANLLPIEHRDGLRSEYKLRLSLGALGLSACVLVVGIVFLFPSFILTEARERQHEYALEAFQAESTATGTKSNTDVIQSTNRKLTFIGDQQEKQLRSTKLLRLTTRTQPPGVSIRRISIKEGDNESGQETSAVSVSGVAQTRSALLRFEDNLNQQPQVRSIDLPVETLADQSDAEFSMTVTVRSL